MPTVIVTDVINPEERNDQKRRNRNPRAVVLILGFGAATPRILAKYADLYHHHGCSTVAGTAPTDLIFFRANEHEMEHLDGFARSLIREVCKAIREHEAQGTTATATGCTTIQPVPVAMHILSNGGAFVARRIGVLINSNANKTHTHNKDPQATPVATLTKIDSYHRNKDSNDDDDDDDDVLLFANRLQKGYQLFDSAPCYPTLKSSWTVIQQILPNPWIGVPLSYLFAIRVVILPKIISFLTGGRVPNQGDLFWKALIEDSSLLCPRQAFVYTEMDEVAPSDKIEDFSRAIEARRDQEQQKQQRRRQQQGSSVGRMHLEDSQHVQHLRLHPEKYVDLVETLLQEMEEANAIDQRQQKTQ